MNLVFTFMVPPFASAHAAIQSVPCILAAASSFVRAAYHDLTYAAAAAEASSSDT